jgi:DNA-binding MarR family transcriptional regulator
MAKGKSKTEVQAGQVADRLHSAAIHLLRQVRKQDAATAEGPARLSALSVLVFGGPMTLGQLAAAEGVKPPTMTRIVKGLETSGLAARAGDPKDARRIQIRPTAKGKRLMQRGREGRIRYLTASMEGLTGDELKLLARAAEKMERLARRMAGSLLPRE